MFILISKVNRLLMGRNGYFSLWYPRHQRPSSPAKPIFLPACLSNPGDCRQLNRHFPQSLCWPGFSLSPSLCLSPSPSTPLSPLPSFSLSLFLSLSPLSLPVWFSILPFLCFCLRKTRDIHDTEANNVELTKFLRPYPSNKTITICSEDKPAIIHCILCTDSITCEGKHTAPFWVLSLSQRKWSVSFWCTKT